MSTHEMTHSNQPLEHILAELLDGNRRFAEGRPRLAPVGPEVRSSLVCDQSPGVAVLACSDSRVGPEIILDRGLGELFVVRVAGNVVDDTVLGSLEYAVEHLGVALILVMGHSACGAVTSACSCHFDELEGATGTVLKALEPAVEAARSTCSLSEGLVDTSARLNVETQVKAVLASPVINEAVAEGQSAVRGAWYDLATGLVSWL
ncbi:MAG: carbonic anhydrase [Thermoleophilia bacterium]|nr:carbonic anhydrase [Thermoleophilia bacterium]